jgi:rod shape-determining protein MreC
MKSFRVFLLGGICLAIFLFFLFFRIEFFGLLKNARLFLKAFLSYPINNYENLEKLKLENISLKQQLAAVRDPLSVKKDDLFEYFAAEVYSRYPFSDRGRLLINAGTRDGLREGLPVLAEKGILLGKISAVKQTQSEVQTIFDNSWRESVAIGKTKTRALLQGGNWPELHFIEPGAVVVSGDEVVNLSPELPFGIFVGQALNPEKDKSNIWQRARLSIPYDVDTLDRVFVILNFP